MKINATFFIPSIVPLTPEGGTMVDGHADVQAAMVPPSGVRGIPMKNIAINILKNLSRTFSKKFPVPPRKASL